MKPYILKTITEDIRNKKHREKSLQDDSLDEKRDALDSLGYASSRIKCIHCIHS